MKLSDGVEWGIHCCAVLATLPEGTALPAARLAEFHGVPAAYLAKHLQALSRAGIVATEPGQRGGYRLARPPSEITLGDVVAAVDGSAPAFRCTEIRRRGPAALPDRQYTRACGIARAMQRAEQAWRAELQATTLADVLADLASSVPPRALQKAGAWFMEVLR
ncbi:MAG TPA: Rrf2 family transcriptional regulator [Candidatus Dormibacteraeota bacterium]|jgi:Rrf2 family protein|nr:Rrf2 family transcriptional regulator [Candidatus Dormibacteraeota bacterium]